ncbi:MAG: hypothetical protein K6G33_05450 [Ruminococcus sp.]|uniref:hypothetical protein n=1 Tax=Ruminococcus sp. TaxID=41978 RepID=UPI0025E6EBC5|nr:hypothetical protein [Ruminococcus sp.]MCR5600170.1 hypothetical protein [Ruminococcus sp.]
MQKKILTLVLCLMCAGLSSCGTENKDTDVLPKSITTTTTATEQTSKSTETTQAENTEAAATTQAETTLPEQTEAPQPVQTEAATTEPTETKAAAISETQALEAIKSYCINSNPSLKNIVDSGENSVYWTVSTNDANEIVVLYRSYTAAQLRYYIDPVSGDTYVTELVPGIIDEEQRTGETFNIKNYIA